VHILQAKAHELDGSWLHRARGEISLSRLQSVTVRVELAHFFDIENSQSALEDPLELPEENEPQKPYNESSNLSSCVGAAREAAKNNLVAFYVILSDKCIGVTNFPCYSARSE
jgi:hypothetical protein